MGLTFILSILSSSLFAVSELLAFNTKIKSNGIIQSLIYALTTSEKQDKDKDTVCSKSSSQECSSDVYLRIKNNDDNKISTLKLIIERS